MFVRSSRLDRAIEQLRDTQVALGRAEAVLEWTQAEATRLARQLSRERAEVRRLTNVIIRLREERNLAAPVGAADETWEPYNAWEEVEQRDRLRPLAEQQQREREVRAIERELLDAVIPDD